MSKKKEQKNVVTIHTPILQLMVAKAVKGAGNNKLLPITSLMALELHDGVLTLKTTDATNTLYIDGKVISGESFYAVVSVDLFSKLVAKFTCDTVTMQVENQALLVNGNGDYTLEMPVEDGEIVHFPDPLESDVERTNVKTVKVAMLKNMYDKCSASVAVTLEEPCYTGYYMMPDKCITTDTLRACGVAGELEDNAVLLSPSMMSLVNVFTDELVTIAECGNYRLFVSDSCRLYGPVMDDIDEYQIDAISGLLYEDKYPNECKLRRDALMEVLDRIALFVTTYENRAVAITFTKDGVMVSNMRHSGTEMIVYEDAGEHSAFECMVDVQMLFTPLKALSGDVITVCYGLDNALRIVDGDVTQVVSLLQE